MTDIEYCDATLSPFAGLTPTRHAPASSGPRHLAPREPSRTGRNLLNTVPFVLVGSLAVAGVGLAAPHSAKADASPRSAAELSELRAAVRTALSNAHMASTATAVSSSGTLSAAALPATYRVRSGDTVSAIAGRHGLSTVAVLALNGLSWRSLIFPGQVLKLTSAPAPAPVPTAPAPTPAGDIVYTIKSGDTISALARRYGVSTISVLSANGLGWSSIIYPGQRITIPGTAPVASPEPPAPAPAPAPEPVEPPVEETPEPETPPEPEPEPAVPSQPTSASYTIRSGDTITAIARKFGVSIQSILTANGLTYSSIIYTGHTLVIPGVQPAAIGDPITLLSPEMSANATTIIRVGQELGVSEYGIVIALATAMQESSLRNINYGHLDSVGLFQQRPSAGWGTVTQLTDPAHAARLFYGGPSNPNKGKTRGLLDISGWQSMTVTQAAQAVQISAYPNAYAKWETSARAWYAQLK